jgi:HSP20 family protein
MSQVKVETPKGVAKTEGSVPARSNDFFPSMLPVGRFFGMNPFHMMREFTDELDRMFRATGPADGWTPAVDVRRCNGDLVVTAELPGLKKEEIKVEVTATALAIEGERKREHTEDHEGYHRYERSYGKFYRTIPLPEGAKTELAKAELTDGVLKISIPAPAAKKLDEPAKTRQIPVAEGAKTTAAAA